MEHYIKKYKALEDRLTEEISMPAYRNVARRARRTHAQQCLSDPASTDDSLKYLKQCIERPEDKDLGQSIDVELALVCAMQGNYREAYERLSSVDNDSVSNVYPLDHYKDIAYNAMKGRGRNPDFIILGGQKCGSTTFGATLKRKKRFIQSIRRESHFFDRDEYYICGLPWYRAHFHRKNNARNDTRVYFEKTPKYTVSESSLSRIARDLPETTRFGLILRDPVLRAYSNYWDTRRRWGAASIDQDDFLATLEREYEQYISSLDQQDHFCNIDELSASVDGAIFIRSLYAYQLKVISKYFDKSRIFITSLEKLVANHNEVMNSLCEFLNIENDEVPLHNRNTNKPSKPRLTDATYNKARSLFKNSDEELFNYCGLELY